jgi:hypothetical protein
MKIAEHNNERAGKEICEREVKVIKEREGGFEECA